MCQCRICLRYFESVNELAAHSQSAFKCERYDMDAIRLWALVSKPDVDEEKRA